MQSINDQLSLWDALQLTAQNAAHQGTSFQGESEHKGSDCILKCMWYITDWLVHSSI